MNDAIRVAELLTDAEFSLNASEMLIQDILAFKQDTTKNFDANEIKNIRDSFYRVIWETFMAPLNLTGFNPYEPMSNTFWANINTAYFEFHGWQELDATLSPILAKFKMLVAVQNFDVAGFLLEALETFGTKNRP